MAKKITRWSPDTCGCVFEYEWDPQELEDVRSHTFKRAVNVCPLHQTSSGDGVLGSAEEDAFGVVVGENTGKNKAIAKVVELIGEDKIKPEDIGWSFDESRQLKLKTDKLTETEKINVLKELKKIDDKIDLK